MGGWSVGVLSRGVREYNFDILLLFFSNTLLPILLNFHTPYTHTPQPPYPQT